MNPPIVRVRTKVYFRQSQAWQPATQRKINLFLVSKVNLLHINKSSNSRGKMEIRQ